MLWGRLGATVAKNRVKVERIMTKGKYVEILKENRKQSAVILGLSRLFILQYYTSVLVKKHLHKVIVTEWPAQSPDLNPTGNMWGDLWKARRSSNLEELERLSKNKIPLKMRHSTAGS